MWKYSTRRHCEPKGRSNPPQDARRGIAASALGLLAMTARRQSGVALMIVLAAVTVLTAAATDFMYSTNVNYHLSMNELERYQAGLLAESSIKLMQLELSLEKQLRSSMSSSPMAQMMPADMSAPLCQQFPLSTGLIRSLFMGDTSALTGTATEEGPEEDAPKEEGSPAHFVTATQTETAGEFLDFEGDFDGTCEDEASKFNLNMFFGKNPAEESLSGTNSYDKAKQMLMNILLRPEFKKLFPKDNEKKISEVARNIADWVDNNTSVNEMGRTATGNEDSLYPLGESDSRVKNAKFLSMDELFKVADVNDEWFAPMRAMFTIYGGDKINVCVAPDETVAAIIAQYVTTNPELPQVNTADKEIMAKLVSAVKNSCGGVTPDVNQIATDLDKAIGVTTSSTSGTETEAGAEAGTATATGSKFAEMITVESRYYTLIGSGTVGDTAVKITSVLDTQDSKPSRWKFVYWKVE